MSTLIARLNAVKQNDVETRIAAKLASGKFTNTGAQYNPAQAQADCTNPALRMTANVDASGALTWKR